MPAGFRRSLVIRVTFSCLVLAGLASCGQDQAPMAPLATAQAADAYLTLALRLDSLDPGYVVSFSGSEEVQAAAHAMDIDVREIARRAREMAERLTADSRTGDAESAGRRVFLTAQLESLAARAEMLAGARASFVEEADLLFDMEIPDRDARIYVTALHARMHRIMPGQGLLSRRIEAFRSQFVIPREKLAEVMEAAVAECRRRTLEVLELPRESLSIEYVTGVNWVAFNEYLGDGVSVIRINTELPLHIDRAVEVGCHEGYPGHHVSNLLREKVLVRGKGWQEFALQTLYSPRSLLEEGMAAYATELIFPREERVRFERDVLFEIAGFDRAQAHRYLELMSLTDELAYADIEAARRYLDGEWSPAYTVQWLLNYRLLSPERARQRLAVFDAYRSFVAAVYLGRELVRKHINSTAAGDTLAAWAALHELMTSPTLPSDIRN